MDISIGIMAHNEEANIGNLLKILLEQKLRFVKKIIVVNDGSTDKTAEIVKEFLKNKKIKLIDLKKRGGKVKAINHFLKTAKSEILILESADNIPHKNAIKELIKEFRDLKVGIVGAHIIPLNKKEGFVNFFGHLIYDLHHEIALKNPKFGELIAFRNVIKKIPMTAVDEECLAMLIKEKKYRLKYCTKAIVYNKSPESVKDIIIQRRRIYAGHIDLKKNFGYETTTMSKINILNALIRNSYLFNIKIAHWILGAALLEMYCRFLGWFDLNIKNEKHYVWEIVRSVKKLD